MSDEHAKPARAPVPSPGGAPAEGRSPDQEPKAEAGGLPSGLAFFMEEWGLLLLAGIMTFGSWWIVREQVVQAHRIDGIRVMLVVDPSVRDQCDAILTKNDTLSITLNCSEREKNEAINALKRTGVSAVTLRILNAPREQRGFTEGLDVFDWPFDDERLLDQDFVRPDVRVFRIEPTKLRVEVPETVRTPEELREIEALRVEIAPNQPSNKIAGPAEAFQAPLVADPVAIDPAAFPVREDGSYQSERLITLTFNTWRNAPGEAWLQAYKRQVKLPTIKALVTVTRVGAKSLENRVQILADQSKYEFVFDLQAFPDKNMLQTSDGLFFTDTLRGPISVLEELGGSKDLWSWGVRLLKDPATEFAKNPGEDISLSAEIVWLPYDAFQNRGVVYEKGAQETEFTVRVSKRKPQ